MQPQLWDGQTDGLSIWVTVRSKPLVSGCSREPGLNHSWVTFTSSTNLLLAAIALGRSEIEHIYNQSIIFTAGSKLDPTNEMIFVDVTF